MDEVIYFDTGSLLTAGILILIVWLICAAIGASLWRGKGGDGGDGFIVGLFFGPIGLLFLAILTPKAAMTQRETTRECPHCKEAMKRDASVCPHCQRDSQPWKWENGYWWARRDEQWLYLDERKNEWVRWKGFEEDPVTSSER